MCSVQPKRLGDLINLKRGYDLPEKDRIPGPFPVISSAGTSGFHNEYKVQGEGVVTGRYGTLGEMYFISGKYWPHNTALYVQDFKGNDPKYIYYLLKCIGRIRTSDKSAVPGVNRNELHEMAVPAIDDKSLQVTIRKPLESIDAKIELHNRINTKLEAMAKTLYDYWFIQFDFPDANGKPYKTSGGEMVYNATLKREIPEGWTDGIASNLLEFNPTTSLKTGCVASYIDMDSIPVRGFMTKKPVRKKFSGGVKFKKNDVAVARITPCLENGKTAFISRLPENEVGFGSTEFIILRGRKEALPGFSACLARSKSFRQFAISNMTGTSGRKRIDAKILSTYSLPIPPDELLREFESKVNPMFSKMNAGAVESDELAKLRDWLLPMLMDGQVTVK